MPRANYGPEVKKRAKRLLEGLLLYLNHELDPNQTLPIQTHWQDEMRLVVRAKLRHLEALTALDPHEGKLSGSEIKEVFTRLKDLDLVEDNRVTTQGSDSWHFTIVLAYRPHELAANLRTLDEQWEQRRSRQVKTQLNPEPGLAIDKSIQQSVQLIREKIHDQIQVRCGHIRVLDMSQPIELNTIYTTVNIYESISGRKRRDLNDLLQRFNIQDFTHLNPIQEVGIPCVTALQKYSKLMILGKPGSGKTAFLKWLAIECNRAGGVANPWSDLIPVFITLKAFAEAKGNPDLQEYIHQHWTACGVANPPTETLLQQGRVLILLDGLDEIREADHDRVLREIREFSTQFHTCLFVTTCRIAARDYTFEQFTEVEMTDFDPQQITDFVTKWFATKGEDGRATATQFLEKLSSQIRIRDLATNPLLLTLLCLVFQESADFPTNRADLYREGLEVLLRTWDAKRNIERDGLYQGSNLYQELSLRSKEALLSQIAFVTFEQGDYFFKQRTVEEDITEFFHNHSHNHSHSLSGSDHESKSWEIDTAAILKSIEAQHGLLVERARGVYSFSHLTFHEYFTAKKIADGSLMATLVAHITEPAWYEVFLLTVGMLRRSDDLLLMMKSHIDGLLKDDRGLQQFLLWLDERTTFAIAHPTKVGLKYQPAIIKAYHSFLVLDQKSVKNSAISIASVLNHTDTIDSSVIEASESGDSKKAMANAVSSASDNERAIAIAIVIASSIDGVLETVLERNTAIFGALDKAIMLTTDPELRRSLAALQTQLPTPKTDSTELQNWWRSAGSDWINQLVEAQTRFRDLVYEKPFSPAQMAQLDQYYSANLLLVNCLNSDCNVSPPVRSAIEATLLCPILDQETHKI